MYIDSCISALELSILENMLSSFFFKQKTAYDMRISDWSSDVCSSDLGLWLLSVLAWWLGRRRRAAPASEPKHTSVRSCQLAFLAAARGNDPAAQVRSLLAWARAERPAIQHLGGLSAELDDASQRAAIATLQQRHYAGTSSPDTGASLAEGFKRGFVWRAGDDDQEESA